MRRILFAVILCVVALGQSAVQASSSQILVTYFSATGNTRKVAEQKQMLDAAEKIDYVADEECTELTDEQIERFTLMIFERKKKKVIG